MSFRSIVARIRAFFSPAPAAPAPAPAPVWAYTVTRTRGSFISTVAEGHIEAASPAAALAIISLRGLAHPGEAVKIDGTRYRVWAAARPTPIDPAKRSRSGDRKRDRDTTNG